MLPLGAGSPEGRQGAQIQVVLNWLEELKRLVPREVGAGRARGGRG